MSNVDTVIRPPAKAPKGGTGATARKRVTDLFGVDGKEMSPKDRATAITGYELKYRIEAIVRGISGKEIKHIYGGSGAATSPELMLLPRIPTTHLFTDREVKILLGYTVHEICHQLHTDFGLLPGLFADPDKPTKREIQIKEYWNAIEDYRIERVVRAAYPGFPVFIDVTRDHSAGKFLERLANGEISPDVLSNPYKFGAVALTWIGARLNGYRTKKPALALDAIDQGLRNWLEGWADDMAAVVTCTDARDLAIRIVDELDRLRQQQQQGQPDPNQSGQPQQGGQGQQSPQSQQSGSSGKGDQSGGSSGGQPSNGADAGDPGDQSDTGKSKTGQGQSGKDEAGQGEDADAATGDGATGDAASGDDADDEGGEDADDGKSGGAGEESEKDDDSAGHGEEGERSGDQTNEGSGADGDDATDPGAGAAPDDGADSASPGDGEKDGSKGKGEAQDGNRSEEESGAAGGDAAGGEKSDSGGQQDGQQDQAGGGSPSEPDAQSTQADDGVGSGSPSAQNQPGKKKDAGQEDSAQGSPSGRDGDDEDDTQTIFIVVDGQQDADAEGADLEIDEIIAAINALAGEEVPDTSVLETSEIGTNGGIDEKLVKQRGSNRYAQLRREVGPAAARSAGIVRRMLQARDRTRWRTGQEDGDLDFGRLIPMALGRVDVYRTKQQKRQINTALSLLLDNSGSMGGHPLEVCQKTAVVLDMAVQGTPTAFEISGYTGSTYRPTIYRYRTFGQKAVGASSSLGNMDKVQLGGTPVGVPLLDAWARLRVRDEPRKILIVVSDGDADDLQVAKEATRIIEMQGGIVIGISIGGGGKMGRWCTESVDINSVDELPQALTNLLRDKIGK